jgi:hypothetical protein
LLRAFRRGRNCARVSGDGALFFFMSLLFAVNLLFKWMKNSSGSSLIFGARRIAFPGGFRIFAGAVLGSSLIFLFESLRRWSAVEIRSDPAMLGPIVCSSEFWVFICVELFSWLGLSLREDAMERRNLSALIAISGAAIAITLITAGGNIGEGPSLSNNIFSVLLGCLAFVSLWLILDKTSGTIASITEERDLASGIRAAGLLISFGLILGRGVAGNWRSVAATLLDLVHDSAAGPLLLLIAIPIEHALRPSRTHPNRNWCLFGILPAVLFISISIAWVLSLGWWEGHPK